uniref:Uncharacterized protein n=1 Tax=Arundo donax TaxID=35708 RepID=A0A0A9HTT0_ARUDO
MRGFLRRSDLTAKKSAGINRATRNLAITKIRLGK